MLTDDLRASRPTDATDLPAPWTFPTDGGGDIAWPIEPNDIEEGTPTARVAVRTTSPDRLLESGLWSCTKGRFRLTYGCDEIVHVVEGGVIIHADGRSTHLGPGDAAYFRAGLATTWEIPVFVRKVWVMRYADRTPLGRLASLVSRIARRTR